MRRSTAEIVREYGPFPGTEQVGGVTYDGQNVWFAAGGKLNAFDPVSGKSLRSLDVAAHAGTAFDGQHLFQLAEDRIQKIDPQTGRVLTTIPAPGGGGSGLTWAEGTLWMGRHRERKILQLDPETGAVLRTIESNRFVTGVTWVNGELWHGTWENDESELRHVDPKTGEVLESLEMPPGVNVFPSIYLAHTRAASFPDPYAFRPERFLEGAADTFSWIPFGGGTRRCIGAAFAQLEMRVVLRTILRSVELRPASTEPEQIVRRNVTLSPRNGTPAVVRGRLRHQVAAASGRPT